MAAQDHMTPIRVRLLAIALSSAIGFVGGAVSTADSAKDQNVSSTTAVFTRVADEHAALPRMR